VCRFVAYKVPRSKNTPTRRVRESRRNRGGRRDTQWHASSMYGGLFYRATRAKLQPSENKLRKVWLTHTTFHIELSLASLGPTNTYSKSIMSLWYNNWLGDIKEYFNIFFHVLCFLLSEVLNVGQKLFHIARR